MLERRKNIYEGDERMWETVHKQHFSVQAARDGLTIMILTHQHSVTAALPEIH